MKISFLSKKELLQKIDAYCELSRTCFTAKVDEIIIKQRYIDNPYTDLLMCIAEEGNKIVASYSVVPIKVIVDGHQYKAALSLNTMTHPEYEGRGLLTKLASMLYEKMIEMDYSFVYGFPNNLSNGILCAKLGWKDVYEYPTLELIISKKNTIPLKQEKITNDWNSVDITYKNKISVIRSAEYLNWRYNDNPLNIYTLVRIDKKNWFIYHIYNTELNITEFHYDDSTESIKKIIQKAIEIGREYNVEKITTWAKINTIEHLAFEKYGFINKTPIRYFGVKKLTYNGNIDLFDYRNWSIFMGDDNVY